MLSVGLIDSGISSGLSAACGGSRAFKLDGEGGVEAVEPHPDRLGHGTALADILLRGSPAIRLYSAQVFDDRLSCSARQVASALDWLLSERVQLVNLSFGLREDRTVLREACERATAAGVILVASSPARGAPVYPASYPGVIRATGDARCEVGDVSLLQTRQADFGAAVRCDHGSIVGASVGCAHLCGIAAGYLINNPGGTRYQLLDWLASVARYRGPERRTG